MLSGLTAELKFQHHAGPLPPKFLRAFRSAGRSIRRTVDALLPLLALASALEARAESGPEWFVVDVNDEQTGLMNINILPGTRFWTAAVAHPEHEAKMPGDGTTIALILVEMDCRNHRMKFLNLVGKDDEGRVTYDDDGDGKWVYIIPNTIGDGYRRYACGIEEKPEPWVTSPYDLRQTLLDWANE